MIGLEDLCRAKELYQSEGFVPVDVPHVIKKKYSEHTKPEGVPDLHHSPELVYCASSEQSFIQMLEEDQLGFGNYQSLAPCYRPEPLLNKDSCLVFLKLEIISVLSEKNPEQMALIAQRVMSQLGVRGTRLVDTLEGIDLETPCGIELGSYGFRETPSGIHYTYGTGIAFPRFYNAKEKYGNI